jgi:hypothetical protein
MRIRTVPRLRAATDTMRIFFLFPPNSRKDKSRHVCTIAASLLQWQRWLQDRDRIATIPTSLDRNDSSSHLALDT